jgi:hypothetical protein
MVTGRKKRKTNRNLSNPSGTMAFELQLSWKLRCPGKEARAIGQPPAFLKVPFLYRALIEPPSTSQLLLSMASSVTTQREKCMSHFQPIFSPSGLCLLHNIN